MTPLTKKTMAEAHQKAVELDYLRGNFSKHFARFMCPKAKKVILDYYKETGKFLV